MADSLVKTRKSQIPTGALEIIQILQAAGYAAYLAGGSVRDLLLGRKPKDYDIATSARPEQVERCFPKTIPVGREFGIVIVRQAGFNFEVATFRGERGYSDRRRPDEVYWTDAREDALRRDFTINAMFYDPIAERIHDFVSGQIDLKAEIIRFVGDPNARVKEDHLRILRAVRLKTELGFQYDPATYQAIRDHASEINHVSAERVRAEIDRILVSSHRASGITSLEETGLLHEVLPEIDCLRGLPQPKEFHQEGDTLDHTVRAVASLPAKSPNFLVWAVMLHDAGKALTLSYPKNTNDRIRFEGHAKASAKLARQVGVRLKLPRIEIDTIAWLVEHHMHLKGIEKMRPAKIREYLLDPRFRWLLELHKADVLGTIPADLSLYRETKKFYNEYLKRWRAEQKVGEPTPLLTGHDLQKDFNLKPGREVGKLLARLREAQLEHKIHNESEARQLVRQILTSNK